MVGNVQIARQHVGAAQLIKLARSLLEQRIDHVLRVELPHTDLVGLFESFHALRLGEFEYAPADSRWARIVGALLSDLIRTHLIILVMILNNLENLLSIFIPRQTEYHLRRIDVDVLDAVAVDLRSGSQRLTSLEPFSVKSSLANQEILHVFESDLLLNIDVERVVLRDFLGLK